MALQIVTDIEACKAEMRAANGDSSVYEACMIRKGFQKTGSNSYSRSTGISIDKGLALIGAALPAVGAAVGAITKTAEAVGAKPAPTVTPPTSSALHAAAPSPSAAPGPSYALDSKSLLLFAGVAVIFLFAMRK
jgi:hypothetical protein